LRLYDNVDIALDTFPYNGTTTTCEALWMGVPVVTRTGCWHAARVGATLLSSIGLESLAAQDDTAYIDTAVELAGSQTRLRAPTIRNLENVAAPGKPLGDQGASVSNPLKAMFNESFKHRIVCYGTPEAAIITYQDKPWWLTVGFGGPGPLVAAGTGQGNGGTNGAPAGTGAPFHPWFSATGGTADGQWIRGTPSARDTGLHAFSVHAHNGIFPDTGIKTVWIEVEGPSTFSTMPMTFASGFSSPLPSPPVAPGPNPPVIGPLEAVALSGQFYDYQPMANAIPTGTISLLNASWSQASTQVPTPPATQVINPGLPSWLTWDGLSLFGSPGVADVYMVVSVTLEASNLHGSDTQTFTLHVLPSRPLHEAMLDVNDDTSVDVLDVQTIVNFVLSIPVMQPGVTPPTPLSSTVPHPLLTPPATAPRGDVTLNGTVDIVDVQALVNGILGR
jgi:hypothetical protein